MSLSGSKAEVIGLQAAAWLAGNDELLPVFLGSTGASEADFRAALEDPFFLGSVVDFVMMDDAWVRSFCDSVQIPYDMLAQARGALPGGEQVHWT